MTTGASFVVVSDPRGNLEYLSKSLDLAARHSAQAVFVFGDFVGAILTPDERAELVSVRPILLKELTDRHDYYMEQRVYDLPQLGHFMTQNAPNYRRTGENNALRALRALVGLRDLNGRWVESGRAIMRAKRIYSDAEKLFKRAPMPVHVMADTVLAEEVLDSSRWLHFAWFSIGTVAIRALCTMAGDLSDAIPDLAPGPRRGGKPVTLAEYPLASGDVIFSPAIGPMLHEVLSSSPGKMAMILGSGDIDRTYPDVLVATHKRENAYLYRFDGRKVTRRSYLYAGGVFGEASRDDIAEALAMPTTEVTQHRRRELEEQAKLASLGRDLIQFIDLLRAQNPVFAQQVERSKDRVEVILTYIRELEAQTSRQAELLATQRAGLERLVKALEPFLGEGGLQRVLAVLNIPTELQLDVTTWDNANSAVAQLIVDTLKARMSVETGRPEA